MSERFWTKNWVIDDLIYVHGIRIAYNKNSIGNTNISSLYTKYHDIISSYNVIKEFVWYDFDVLDQFAKAKCLHVIIWSKYKQISWILGCFGFTVLSRIKLNLHGFSLSPKMTDFFVLRFLKGNSKSNGSKLYVQVQSIHFKYLIFCGSKYDEDGQF